MKSDNSLAHLPGVGVKKLEASEPVEYDRNEAMRILSLCACKSCSGTGERHDADVGDISFNTWECTDCGGKGWDRQIYFENFPRKSALEPSAARKLALEEAARAAENAMLEYNLSECAGLADWAAFEAGQESGLKHAAAAIRSLGTSCEQLNKAVSNVQDQQENEPGAHGERERVLEEAAHNAAMYLATGFISCPRCGEDVETKNTDAEYTLRAALSSPDHADAGKLVEGDGWLPIESAPMDGTWFLAYRPEPDGGTWDRLCIVCWSAEEDDFVWPDDTFDIYRDDLSDMDDRGFLKFDTYSSCGSFTHWRPLPSAPSQEVAGS